MRLLISTTYTITSETTLDLPDPYTWDDVETFHVKWQTLYLFFKDGTEAEIELRDPQIEDFDFKRPDSTEVYSVVDGEPLHLLND